MVMRDCAPSCVDSRHRQAFDIVAARRRTGPTTRASTPGFVVDQHGRWCVARLRRESDLGVVHRQTSILPCVGDLAVAVIVRRPAASRCAPRPTGSSGSSSRAWSTATVEDHRARRSRASPGSRRRARPASSARMPTPPKASASLTKSGSASRVGMRIAAAVQQLLPLAHHAHILVVQDEDLDRQVDTAPRSTSPGCSSGSRLRRRCR